MTEVPPELRRVKQEVERELLNQPGVVGVDIGYKEVGGEPTDELAIRVLVQSKRDVPAPQAIPPKIEGVTTDVIERQYELHVLTALASETAVQPDTGTYEPLQGGISIGPCRPIAGVTYSGTLGAVLTDNVTGQPMLLSAYHVMAINPDWTAGDGISQPSRPDAGVCPGSIAGRLERAAMTDKVDCAIAKATKGTLCEVVEIGPLTGAAKASIGQTVRKRGRTSGLTYGTIDTVDLTLQIDYGEGPHVFTDQIGIMPDAERNPMMGTHGDSGSVLVTEDGAVVGLYFGGDEQSGHGVANPIDAVLSAMNVSLCTAAGPVPAAPPETTPPGQPSSTPPVTPPGRPSTNGPSGEMPPVVPPGGSSAGVPPSDALPVVPPGGSSAGVPPSDANPVGPPGGSSPSDTPPTPDQSSADPAPAQTPPVELPRPRRDDGEKPPPWPVWPGAPVLGLPCPWPTPASPEWRSPAVDLPVAYTSWGSPPPWACPPPWPVFIRFNC